jgi:hypothetical protein
MSKNDGSGGILEESVLVIFEILCDWNSSRGVEKDLEILSHDI